ncbi:MAG: hypothetical protein GX423_13050 [Nitrospiraceae bacterium]|jgi:hypothetical protein|nr:hypothetical protein [Nitrospiraceae bacterium]
MIQNRGTGELGHKGIVGQSVQGQMSKPISAHLRARATAGVLRTIFGSQDGTWRSLLLSLAWVAVFFVAAGWLPDGVAELFQGQSSGLWKTAGALCLLVGMGVMFRRALCRRRELDVVQEPPGHKKALGIFLSSIWGREEETERLIERGDVGSASRPHPWEMPLLAVDYHSDTLTHLYIFVSCGEKGSAPALPLFRRLISSRWPHLAVVVLPESTEGVDFENIHDVFDMTEALYLRAKADGFQPQDVIIDITGGQKTTSIAAAMATLASGRRFQYVSTTSKKVRAYDVVYTNSSER